MISAATLVGWWQRVMPATPRERGAALWSFAYFFALLAGYYVLKPIRDQMGIAGGTKNLPWLLTATFVTLLVAQPFYGALVARLPRAKFIPVVYHFFVANLLLFWLALLLDIEKMIVARVFFVWVSVFNLFAVAVFWSFMADMFTAEQGKRLFGFIGAGGTAGGLLAPIVVKGWLWASFDPAGLLIVSAVFVELAVFCVYRIGRLTKPQTQVAPEEQRVGGSIFAGLIALIRSPYLLGVAGWVSLLSFGATVLYMAQAELVSTTVHGAAAQTNFFASIDLTVNLLTLATQVVATASFLKRFGIGVAAAALPAAYVAGFAVLAVSPVLAVVFALQVVQRWMNFAIANPARHLFFTVVGREEKYKAKNVIDVVVYRGSDSLYGWVYHSLQAFGLKLGAVALCMLPVAVGWAALSIALGRTQERRAAEIKDQGVSE